MRIGLDVLGGDFAPEANIKGVALALKVLPAYIKLCLIGDEKVMNDLLVKENADLSRIEFVHTAECIQMGEHPTKAFSKKPNSSIAIGFGLLKQGKIDAFASTGNTGAMLVGSVFTIKAITGVIRPCITSVLPTEEGKYNIILDVGTNADCKPDVLHQFAKLGSIYAEHVHNIKNPKVGLLNIGEEDEKGNLLTLAAHQLMKDSTDFNFVGNIEGNDIFGTKANVVVCDGFTGNVVLKEAEAFYSLVKKRGIKDEYFDRFNYEMYGGTPILGVNGNVIIGHGKSTPEAVKNMLLLCRDVIDARLPERIKQAFE